ncbi:sodium:solute symporter [Chloroflexota bacterium]
MLELIIILAYLAMMLAVGFWKIRKNRAADDYFVAGRKGSTGLVTGSLMATIIGGSATIGMAGIGFSQGLTGAWWLLSGSVGLFILGLFFAKKVRRFSLYTLPELVAAQYGRGVATAASALIVIAWVGVTAAQIIAAGKILGILGYGNPTLWMVIFSGVFVTYTLVGGQRAVLRTDAIQSVIIFAGIFGGLALALSRAGGFDALQNTLGASYFSFPVSQTFPPLRLLSMLLLVGMTYLVGPDMYSRLFCAKDDTTAKKATLWSAGLLLPIAFAITLIGMSAAVLFPAISPELAFPTVIKEVFPPFAGGLVLAALLCAVMSSADTTLLSAATIFSVDLLGGMKTGRASAPQITRTRVVVAVLGMGCLMVALLLNSVIGALLFAYTVYSAGVILPTVFGFFKDRLKLTPAGAMAALIGGGGLGLTSKFVSVPNLDLGAVLLSGVLLFAVSAVDRRIRRGGSALDG